MSNDYLQKSQGEGSHGGKVIGHTKSGKPIYDTHYHESHKNFSAQDHRDAEQLNEKLKRDHYEKYKQLKEKEGGRVSDKAAKEHNKHIEYGSNAYYHNKKADNLERRGGNINSKFDKHPDQVALEADKKREQSKYKDWTAQQHEEQSHSHHGAMVRAKQKGDEKAERWEKNEMERHQRLAKEKKDVQKALTTLSIAHLQGSIDDDTIEKARNQAGVYANTYQNRKLGRVGQKYKEGDNQEKMPTREEISKVFSKAGWYSGGTIVREISPGVFVFGMDEEGSSEENKKKIDKYLNDPEMGIKPLFKDKFNLDDIKVDISEPKSRGYGNPKRIYFTVDINKDKYSEPEKQILGGFTASIENKGISPKITITKGPHHVITLNVPNNIKGKENLEAYAREQLQQMKGVKTATDKEKKLKIEDLSIMELMSLAPGKGASKEEREKSKWVLDEIERRTKEHSKQKIDKIVNYLKENKMTTSEQELIDVAEVVNVNLSPKEKDMIREQYQSKDSKEGKHISDMKYSEKLAWAKELGIKKPESLSLKELNNQIIDHNVKKQLEDFKGKRKD